MGDRWSSRHCNQTMVVRWRTWNPTVVMRSRLVTCRRSLPHMWSCSGPSPGRRMHEGCRSWVSEWFHRPASPSWWRLVTLPRSLQPTRSGTCARGVARGCLTWVSDWCRCCDIAAVVGRRILANSPRVPHGQLFPHRHMPAHRLRIGRPSRVDGCVAFADATAAGVLATEGACSHDEGRPRPGVPAPAFAGTQAVRGVDIRW